jgi:hypothetical protein
MGDRSFALGPTYDGFKVYCDIVRAILLYHNNIMNSYYDTENAGGDPLDNVNTMIKTLSNFISDDTIVPYGYEIYNIDNSSAETQSLLLPMFYSLKIDRVNLEYAQHIARNAVVNQVKWLQKHLIDLITDSSSYYDINEYYLTNQTYNNSNSNVLNGGYHFTSDWNRLSTSVGVPYDSLCDKD